MTQAEKTLWRALRHKQVLNAKFRRQVPIGPYVVDFACLQANLIIEVDGGQHNSDSRDAERDSWLAKQGLCVLRFWNNDVLSNIEGVLSKIAQTLSPHPNPPPQGGRERIAPQQPSPSRLEEMGGGARQPNQSAPYPNPRAQNEGEKIEAGRHA